MFADFHLFCLGAATVVDTALLLSVLERRNWRYVATPLVAILLGVWLFHVGVFADLLLIDATGRWPAAARWVSRSVMCCGLLLMPSAMLHGAIRFSRTGFALRRRRNWAYLPAYLPVLALPAAMVSLTRDPSAPFLDLLAGYLAPYVVWVCLVNVGAAASFLLLRQSREHPDASQFLAWIAVILVAMSGWLAYALFLAADQWRDPTSLVPLSVLMMPLVPALLFAYFVIQYRFMQLILERTLVYGALLAAVLLFHQLVVDDLVDRLDRTFKINFVIVEGVILFFIILAYQPMRRRVAESLRYLLGHSLEPVRERTRKISIGIWQHLADSPPELLDWFVDSLSESFGISTAAAWLYDDSGQPVVVSGDVANIDAAAINGLRDAMPSHGYVSTGEPGSGDFGAFDRLKRLQGSFAVRLDHENISGLLFLGRRPRGGEASDEETHSILLLVEQLGVALHNAQLQGLRLAAERRAAQNEKLSTLGLLTSCVAHEIKNPLSSIKTIATVLGEQLGPDHQHAEDVRMILEEVQRLGDTTTQFLAFSRPNDDDVGPTELRPAIDSAVHVLSHLARRQGVDVVVQLPERLRDVTATQNSLREILFNLLLNAIEAAGSQAERPGRVTLEASDDQESISLVIRDNGPGIARDLRERIFDPFVSGKAGGTGLGLFIVGRAVNEAEGTIDCQSDGEGTRFTVRLPATPAEVKSRFETRRKTR